MSTQAKRAATVTAAVLTVCLLLTLVAGSFLVSSRSHHSAQIARGATPYGWTCGGSVGTPC
jgi:hypothetical protein